MIIIVMGVSGCGKSTVGAELAKKLNWQFLEGDAFHPAVNIEKMSKGIALTDADRAPWLAAIAGAMQNLEATDRDAVVACSALKEQYREVLRSSMSQVKFVWLKGSYEVILARMKKRAHFFNPTLLKNQFEILEAPTNALEVCVEATPEQIEEEIIHKLNLR